MLREQEIAPPLVLADFVAPAVAEVPRPDYTGTALPVPKIKSSKSKEAPSIQPKFSGIGGKSIMYEVTEQQQSKKNTREEVKTLQN